MELCTACIWTSAQWSQTVTPNRRASYHGFVRSISTSPQRRRRSTLCVMNAASTSAPVSSQSVTQLPRSSGSGLKSISSNKPSSAMEQLDIERGVCIPFRKYTPEMVLKSASFYVYRIDLLKVILIVCISTISRSGKRYWIQEAPYYPSLVGECR
jgi:aarF domain-containing kinase